MVDRIFAALARDGRINMAYIEIVCRDGTAILRGAVESEELRSAAAATALGETGVQRVENRLLVTPGYPAGSSFGKQATEIGAIAIKDAQKLADQAARKLGELFPSWRVGAEAISGRAALGLLEKAGPWHPDLIVLGSHGRTGIRKLVLGSVSLRILHPAKADVRISRFRADRGKAKAVRFQIGSISCAVAAHASCSVEVVREGGGLHGPKAK